MSWKKVDQAMCYAAVEFQNSSVKKEATHNHAFPGAVLLVGQSGEIRYRKAFGCRSLLPEVTPMHEEMVFDVASLSKVLVTTTLLMQLVDRSQVTIDRKLARIFQSFNTFGKETMTVRHLLNHSSGYPATIPFYKQIAKAHTGERAGIMSSRGAVEFVYNEIFRARLENVSGKVAKYSDIGFILLGDLIEILNSGTHLDRIADTNIFSPLGLRSTSYIDLSKIRRRGLAPITEVIAPTLQCSWRKKMLCGEVHDDNAWAMGGIAGHAGVFSTAEDLHVFLTEMVNCWRGEGSLVNRDVVRYFWTRDDSVPGSSWALGWDTPSDEGSSSGQFFSKASVGHLGYTGCSVWVDPTRELHVILLSNRIHPSDENVLIREFRPLIHDLVMEALGYDRKR